MDKRSRELAEALAGWRVEQREEPREAADAARQVVDKALAGVLGQPKRWGGQQR